MRIFIINLIIVFICLINIGCSGTAHTANVSPYAKPKLRYSDTEFHKRIVLNQAIFQVEHPRIPKRYR